MLLRKFPRFLLLGAFVLTAAGCGSEALTFNNAIVAYNKRLELAGKQFGEALIPFLKGGGGNVAQLRKTHAEILTTVEDIKKDFAARKVPSAPGAEALAKGYEKFLKGQENAAKNEMAQIVKLAEAPGGANGPRMIGLLQDVARREQTELTQLQNLQREFARANNIRLQAAPKP